MARARKYPPANTTAQWFEELYSRTTMNPVSKLLLHTTETAGWPGYAGGASAPTITYNPWVAAGQRWRQHNFIDRSARALRDPAGTAVRENQDGVVQVEIICYCDPKLYAKYGHGVNKLPDHAYEDLGAFLAFLHTEHDVPLVRAPKWDTFPPSDSIRMTGPEYDAFRGVLGHQHASGNTHGDPGMTNAQVDRILTAAKRLTGTPTTPAKPPAQEGSSMSAAEVDRIMTYLEAVSTGIRLNTAQNMRNLRNDLNASIGASATKSAAEIEQLIADQDAENDKAIAELQADLDKANAKLDALAGEAEPPKA